MLLKDINLTEDQQKEMKEKLDDWKLNEKKRIETELTEKYEQMEATLKEESEQLVEELKSSMKEVYTKRFIKALKEMYEEIKAQVIVENLHSPEAKALEEVKASVYPFINESTVKRHRDEFAKLAEMFNDNQAELEILKGANKKSQLLESLTPEVRKVVDKLIGNGTVEEIVEKFATIKKALKEQADNNVGDKIIETTHTEETTTDENTLDEETEVTIERSIDEDVTEETPAEDPDFKNQLDEQLILAGIKKAKR